MALKQQTLLSINGGIMFLSGLEKHCVKPCKRVNLEWKVVIEDKQQAVALSCINRGTRIENCNCRRHKIDTGPVEDHN